MALYLCQKSRVWKHILFCVMHADFNCTCLIFAHIFSNRVKQRQVRASRNNNDTHYNTVQLLWAHLLAPDLALSLLCTRSRQRLFTLWGRRPRLTPAVLWWSFSSPRWVPFQFPTDDSFHQRLEAQRNDNGVLMANKFNFDLNSSQVNGILSLFVNYFYLSQTYSFMHNKSHTVHNEFLKNSIWRSQTDQHIKLFVSFLVCYPWIVFTVVCCAAWGCSNHSEKGVHMYGFPKDRSKAWVAKEQFNHLQRL